MPKQKSQNSDPVARLSIVYRPVSELKANTENPRDHSSKQITQLAKSLEAFGFNVPILVDASGGVIAGHGRLLACRKLGWSEAPTICIDHLNDAQKRAFMIADNRLTENSTWNKELLAHQFKILSDVEIGLDLELTGFEVGEIDLLIDGTSPKPEEKYDPEDEMPATSGKRAVTKPSDLWTLGNHRVYCGSALDPEAYKILLNEKAADIVFTDPPYNVPIDGHVSTKGKKHREFAMASGEMSPQEFNSFLSRALGLAAENSNKGSIHFVCMDWRHAGDLLAAAAPAYSELKNICVWVKDAAGMGSLYRSKHELVFVFKNGKTPHKNNVRLGVHGRYRSNVWSYPGIAGFGRGTDEGRLAELHPTVKPVQLIADALLDCSSRGDVVLDGFLGSGSTLLAAQRTGRKCVGIEIDPLYVDTIVRRFQTFTGMHAIHSQSGRTFNDLERKGTRK